MIAMSCSCGREFWVRDRLAGREAGCPACGQRLAIPPPDVVEATTTAVACGCGEVFRSARWRPGRLTKCPLCGRAVGPPSGGMAAPPEGGPMLGSTSHPRTPTMGSGDPEPRDMTTASPSDPATRRLSGTEPRMRRPVLTAGAGAMVLLILGATVLLRALNPSPRGGGNPGVAAPKHEGGGADKPSARETPAGVDPEAVSPRPSPPPGGTDAATRLQLLVPAYFYPGGPTRGDWDRLIEAAARVPIIAVVNPASGPGEAANPDYIDVVRRGTRAGVTFIGYVNTEYARRPRAEVEADVERWIKFYPEVRGFFFDAQASEARHIDLYASLYGYAKGRVKGALVVTNPGTICDEGYLARPAADVAILFEDSRGLDAFRPPPWAARYDPRRLAAIPYGISDKGPLRDAVRQVSLQGMGYVYATEGRLPNPWGRLTAHWEDLIEAVKRVNERRPL